MEEARQYSVVSGLLNEIRRLLWFEWDPIDINDEADWPDDEYDSYALKVYRMLIDGRDQRAISKYLQQTALEHIGVSKSENHDAIATRAIEIFEEKR